MNKIIAKTNIESIGFKVSSGPKYITWLDVATGEFHSEESDDMMYPFDISITNEDNDNTIGAITGFIVNSDIDFWTMDGVSADFSEIAAYALKTNGGFNGKYAFRKQKDGITGYSFILIDRFFINEELRSNGIGSIVLKPALKALIEDVYELFDEGPFGIVLCASAYEFLFKDNYDEMSEKLIDFYKRIGFKRIKESRVMYLTEVAFKKPNKI